MAPRRPLPWHEHEKQSEAQPGRTSSRPPTGARRTPNGHETSTPAWTPNSPETSAAPRTSNRHETRAAARTPSSHETSAVARTASSPETSAPARTSNRPPTVHADLTAPIMSILVDRNTRVVVQGITGKEGAFHAARCKEYGTTVAGGGKPGNGGTTHE